MPTTWDNLVRLGRPNLGSGVQIPPEKVPQELPINYASFRQGLMINDRPGDIPEGYYSRAVDIETARDDSVSRAPGITLIEDTAHDLSWLAVHAGLDNQSVLLAFDSAHAQVGIKEAGNFVWSNVIFTSQGSWWVWTTYGDTMVFTDGRVAYTRNFDTQTIFLQPDIPGAATLFVAFGRIFAGGTILNGESNPMGVMWAAASGDVLDWSGDGSGAELLITDAQHRGDKIVAARILSFDIVAILCRHSIWIAQRTQDAFRPADFRFRIMGVGCASEPTAKTTEGGVTFLSDEGVRHFDGQAAPVISSAINAELLPIDFTQINKYRSEWDGDRRRYILVTPNAVYIYQFPIGDYPQGAWFKRSAQVTNVVAFATQTVDPTWDDFALQTWDDLTKTWLDYATPESDGPANIYFAQGTKFGIVDPAVLSNFGVAFIPLCEPRPRETVMVNNPDRIIQTQGFLLDYKGSGTIEIWAPNESGVNTLQVSKVLPVVAKVTPMRIDIQFSSQAAGIEVRIVTGTPQIYRIRQLVLSSGITIVGV